jgi:hypothetical protein
MLRACVLSSQGSWDKWLSMAEFSYNNSYQSSIKMSPFEALYGRKCRTPLNWSEAGERTYYGIDLVDEAEEKVRIIRKNMEAAQARQKRYTDKKRRPLNFEIGEYVYLKVSPMKKVQRFGVKRKLAPRFVGPFRIIAKKGPVAYQLQLPREMRAIFSVFHVSQLKQCLKVPEERVAIDDIEIEPDLTYEVHPVQILDTKERATRNHVVKLYKILWSDHGEKDATWEAEDYLTKNYPSFFRNWLVHLKSRDEILLRGEGL